MVLLVGSKGVIDVPLQVNGQVRDPEHRPGDVNQALEQFVITLEKSIRGLWCELTFLKLINTALIL